MKTNPLSMTLGATAILFLAVAAGGQEYTRIFDGATLTGWHKTGNATWTVTDSALVSTAAANGLESYLISDLKAKDFGLRLKFWWTAGNSGVNFRNLEKNGIATGIQVDLDGSNSSGNLYDNVKAAYVASAKPDSLKKWFKPNAWNDLSIEAKGTRIVVSLNGKQTVDHQDAGGRTDGVFALQMHVGMAMNLKFKDIELRDDSNPVGTALLSGSDPRAGRDGRGGGRGDSRENGHKTGSQGYAEERWQGLPVLNLEMMRGRRIGAPVGDGWRINLR